MLVDVVVSVRIAVELPGDRRAGITRLDHVASKLVLRQSQRLEAEENHDEDGDADLHDGSLRERERWTRAAFLMISSAE